MKTWNRAWGGTLLPIIGSLLCAQPPSAAELFIGDVTMIDYAGRGAQPDVSLLISDRRIAAIGPAAQMKASAAAEIIDNNGKYLNRGFAKSMFISAQTRKKNTGRLSSPRVSPACATWDHRLTIFGFGRRRMTAHL